MTNQPLAVFNRVTHRQLVQLSCDGFSPRTVTEGEREVTVTARLENTTSDTVALRWAVTVDGSVVGDFQRVDVPPNATVTPSQTITANFSADPRVSNAIGVRQRFGFQQTDACGTMTVEEAEPEPEPAFDPGLVSVPTNDCGVSPQEIAPPAGVSLSATVRNENGVPAAATVEWTWEGQVIAQAGVNVSANSRELAEATTTIDREGRGQVTAEVTGVSESVEGLARSNPRQTR